MFQKRKPIRLKGKELSDIYQKAFERDEYTCQDNKCPGGYPIDRAPHHIQYKSQGGSDTMDNLITLCIHCHGKAHGVNRI